MSKKNKKTNKEPVIIKKEFNNEEVVKKSKPEIKNGKIQWSMEEQPKTTKEVDNVSLKSQKDANADNVKDLGKIDVQDLTLEIKSVAQKEKKKYLDLKMNNSISKDHFESKEEILTVQKNKISNDLKTLDKKEEEIKSRMQKLSYEINNSAIEKLDKKLEKLVDKQKNGSLDYKKRKKIADKQIKIQKKQIEEKSKEEIEKLKEDNKQKQENIKQEITQLVSIIEEKKNTDGQEVIKNKLSLAKELQELNLKKMSIEQQRKFIESSSEDELLRLEKIIDLEISKAKQEANRKLEKLNLKNKKNNYTKNKYTDAFYTTVIQSNPEDIINNLVLNYETQVSNSDDAIKILNKEFGSGIVKKMKIIFTQSKLTNYEEFKIKKPTLHLLFQKYDEINEHKDKPIDLKSIINYVSVIGESPMSKVSIELEQMRFICALLRYNAIPFGEGYIVKSKVNKSNVFKYVDDVATQKMKNAWQPINVSLWKTISLICVAKLRMGTNIKFSPGLIISADNDHLHILTTPSLMRVIT